MKPLPKSGRQNKETNFNCKIHALQTKLKKIDITKMSWDFRIDILYWCSFSVHKICFLLWLFLVVCVSLNIHSPQPIWSRLDTLDHHFYRLITGFYQFYIFIHGLIVLFYLDIIGFYKLYIHRKLMNYDQAARAYSKACKSSSIVVWPT